VTLFSFVFFDHAGKNDSLNHTKARTRRFPLRVFSWIVLLRERNLRLRTRAPSPA
jgi:hypothetical protein